MPRSPRATHWAATVLLLGAGLAVGQETSDAPTQSPQPATLAPAPQRNPLIPLVEVPLFEFSLAVFNQFVFPDEHWSKLNWSSVAANLRGGWVVDNDNFEVNNIGHPYQGAVAFTATRSAGYGFWQGMLAAGLASLAWEIAGENEPPSLNDLVTTTVGGAFLGEALYRSARALLERPGHAPWWMHVAGAFLIDPFGTFNRWLFDDRYDALDVSQADPVLGTLSMGVNALGMAQTTRGTLPPIGVTLGQEFHLVAELSQGLPGSRSFSPRYPFDHFSVRGEFSMSNRPSFALFTTGLLWGTGWQAGATSAGVLGLFGSWDFANHRVLRVTTVGVGPGVTVVTAGPRDTQWQFLAVLSGVALGGAGQLTQPVIEERDFHLGPGAQLAVLGQLHSRRYGSLSVQLRQYLITGAFSEPGLEIVTSATLGAAIAIAPHLEVVTDAVVTARQSRFFSDDPASAYQRVVMFQLALRYRTDDKHGAVQLVEPPQALSAR